MTGSVAKTGGASRPGLRFEEVALSLGRRSVLRGVSFEVHPGEMVGLLGPNGAGKTTLLRVATRALEPEAGLVLVAGLAISSLSRRELSRRIAVVPQETHIPFPFRVAELVLMGRAPYQRPFAFESAEDLRLAGQAMERVGIGHLSDRSVFELSGGERQLTIFARALAQQPDFLLLDEATAFLDMRNRIDLLQIVREFVDGGGAALVVSHDLALVSRVCDRLVLLAEGVVTAQGAPDRVLTPSTLRDTFKIQGDIILAPDGTPVVVPRLFSVPPGASES
ncbi:MAG: ABC transporter ATP-binding protein [Myxococcota bacterium]